MMSHGGCWILLAARRPIEQPHAPPGLQGLRDGAAAMIAHLAVRGNAVEPFGCPKDGDHLCLVQ